jgi:hypothetical protein
MPEPERRETDKPEKKPAAPLQIIGMGLVIVFLESLAGGFDLFADPVGWLLVIVGTAKLPVGQQGLLAGIAFAAFALAVPLWFPAVHGPVLGADPALDWAAKLPTYGYCFVLCRGLMAAAQGVHPAGHMRFGALSVLVAITVAVPPVAIAADAAWVANTGIALILVSQVWLVWSLFSHSRLPYADAPAPGAAAA